MISLFVLLSFFVVTYSAAALFLWLGATWAGIPHVTLGRAFGATLALGLFSLSLHLGFLWLWTEVVVSPSLAAGIEVGAELLVAWSALKLVFRTTLRQAVACWLPTLVPAAAAVALLYLVLAPYILSVYVATSHSMAPTLLGPHQQAPCPHCGRPSTVSFPPAFQFPGETSRRGICPSCQQSGRVTEVASTVHPADRFVVSRLHTPRRWDLVTFRFPQEPKVRFAKRLIGLPGEEVVIKDGGIWIDGAKIEPPSEIAELVYTAQPDGPKISWGSSERPMRLGDDEYFVLGDFSLSSLDSRYWGAVPGKNIEGVVSLILWPPSRFRIFR